VKLAGVPSVRQAFAERGIMGWPVAIRDDATPVKATDSHFLVGCDLALLDLF